MTRCGQDSRHQYRIFCGKSQTSFSRKATRTGSEKRTVFSGKVLFELFSFLLQYVAIWPVCLVDFMACLDSKVPQQFYSLILFYAFGGTVTALSSIFLAHAKPKRKAKYEPPNNIMPLFIFFSVCASLGNYTKYAAQFHRDYHTFYIWMTHFGFRFWLLWRWFLVPDLARQSPSVSFSSPIFIQFQETVLCFILELPM